MTLVRGTAFANRLEGTADGDVYEGLAGTDVLVASLGDDALDGGDSADTADYSAILRAVHVSLATGVGRFRAVAGKTDTLIGIENLTGSRYGDTLEGDDEGNRLVGGGGADTLHGGGGADALNGGTGDDHLAGDAGDDRLAGGSGTDVLDGGEGIDAADYSAAGAAVTIDLTLAGQNTGGAGYDTLIGIEQAYGSRYGDLLSGDGGANELRGLGGDDRLAGRGGHDKLVGGDGGDLLDGGAGDDVLHGGVGVDTLDGGDGADRLDGGAGDDVMRGGLGDDLYLVNPGDNLAERSGQGHDVVRSTGGFTLPIHFETLILLSSGRATGNNQANTLIGSSGDDTLYGLGGADRMIGGSGDDYYLMVDADDQVVEHAGGGVDTVRAGVSYRLPEHIENFEYGSLGNFNTEIFGNALNNNMSGNYTTLYGEAGDDFLSSNSPQSSSLYGGDGADTLEGGYVMLGGAGRDLFTFATWESVVNSNIGDFSHAEGEKIDLSVLDPDWDWPEAGDQVLTFIGSNDFTGRPGEVRTIDLSYTERVEIDMDGDAYFDIVFFANSEQPLVAEDFIL